MVELSDAERLHEISRATNDDGTVNVELQSFNKTEADNKVGVTYKTPDGMVLRDVMDWPRSDSDEYKFVRIFEQAGYGIVAAEEACSNNISVKATTNPWSLYAPREQTFSDRVYTLRDSIQDFYERRVNGPSEGSRANFWVSLIVSVLFAPLCVFGIIFQKSDKLSSYALGYGHAIIQCLLLAGIVLSIVMFI